MRLLLMRLSALGDVVHALPALELLRAALPGAHLTWVAEPLAAELLAGHPALDRVVVVDRPRAGAERPFAALLRGARGIAALRRAPPLPPRSPWPGAAAAMIDVATVEEWWAREVVAIDLQGLLRSVAVARLGGATRVLGPTWAPEGARLLYHERLDVPRPGEAHAVERAAAIVRAALERLGLPAPPPGLPAPRLGPGLTGAEERAGLRLTLLPGAGKPANRPPAALLAAVADGAAAAVPGLEVLLVGGRSDRDRAARVAARCRVARPVDRTGGSLAASAAALAASDVVLGGDTGPLHLARALGRPVVALFHAADPDRTGPAGLPGPAPARLLLGQAACAPCRAARCRRPGEVRLCLRPLSPGRVLEELLPLLRR